MAFLYEFKFHESFICSLLQDSNGYIDDNELCITMKELGVQLSKDDVKAMMQEAGVKADGRIYYEGQCFFVFFVFFSVFIQA